MFSDYLIGSTIYRDGHPSEISAFVQRHVGMHNLATDAVANRAMLRHTLLGNLGLSVIAYGGRTTVENPVGIDCFHFQFVLSGKCTIRVGHDEMALTPGCATLLNPFVPSAVTYSADCSKLIVNIPKSLFMASLIERIGQRPAQEVRFDSALFALDDRSTTFRAVELLLLEAEDKSATSVARAAAESLFVTKLLDKFPHNAFSGGDVSSRNETLFATVDRYIDAHLGDEISASELAVMCNMSVRTLYDRFTQIKSVTPAWYVKNRKLRRVFERLSSEDARSVSEVATDFGFNHLGRFSSDYRAAFGELPSDTLRRARQPRK
jgi:AraC-like DNA-binding protein